jgi:hypothetical protein
MKINTTQDARTHFAKSVDPCIDSEPLMVTHPSLKELLLSNKYRFDLKPPKRGLTKHRAISHD